MTLYDLFRNGPCVEGHIQISYFHEDKYDREVYYEGEADCFYTKNHEGLMEREIAYIYPDTTLSPEHEEIPMICIELCDEE